MADLSDFWLSPSEFLKKNLFYMRGNGKSVAGLYNFKFEDATQEYGARCRHKTEHWWQRDSDVRVWFVSADAEGGEKAPVFWLPYKENGICKAAIDQDAPFLFTASLTGCTFGSVMYNNGMVEVCHANFQTAEGTLDETRMSQETCWCQKRLEQKKYREKIYGSAVKDVNRQASMGATVVGVKGKNNWTFYAQQWENLDGTNFNYFELIEL
jgi:hypothetical protein